MYSIALVQNQSEMSHYACADARPLLDSFPNYHYRLFTGDNIGDLAALLERRSVHAVVLGSNALNDKSILAELGRGDFAKTLQEFLEAGYGFLSMQQIGLAMRMGPTMTVLPAPYDQLVPRVIQRGDSALRSGRLGIGSNVAPHLTLSYPHAIDLASVREAALAFRGYNGLYWHYWDEVDLADWDQVVVDPAAVPPRSLVLACKESAPGRIVVSSLPLDWQQHKTLFTNLLVYIVEGRHDVATLSVAGDSSLDYLQATLRARCHPFGDYTLPDDIEKARDAIAQGIHSTVVLGSDLSPTELPAALLTQLDEAVRQGKVRVVDIGDTTFGVRSLNVISHELRPRRLLMAAEFQIQQDLLTGYLDDSFWSHVDTLQTLERIPDHAVDYGLLQDAALQITRNHDRDGSYDELFGPTCAYYWLRAAYGGVGSAGAHESAAWLRSRIPEQEPHERALAYHAFASVGEVREDERQDLSEAVSQLQVGGMTESQLILYLRAGIAARLEASDLTPLAVELAGRHRDGQWIDLTTTATVANALLDVHALVAPASDAALVQQLRAAVQSAVILILRHLGSEDSSVLNPYPWEHKARTTTLCLRAWLEFDRLHDVPVSELLENLTRSRRSATSSAATRTALGVLQESTRTNRQLQAQLREKEAAERRASEAYRRLVGAGVVVAVLLYGLVAVLVGLALGPDTLGDGFRRGILESYGFHFGLVGFVATVTGLVVGVLAWLRRGHAHRGDT